MTCRHYQKGGSQFCAICTGEKVRHYGAALTRIASFEIDSSCSNCATMRDIAQDAISDSPTRTVSYVADPAYYF